MGNRKFKRGEGKKEKRKRKEEVIEQLTSYRRAPTLTNGN